MDYLRGFRVVFDDPEWISKTLTATFLLLTTACIPILGQIVIHGWSVETMRRDLRGESGLAPLPMSFEVWKPYLDQGFKHWLVGLAYGMPFGVLVMMFFLVPILATAGVGAAGSDAGVIVAGMFACGSLLFIPVTLAWFALATYAQIRADLRSQMGAAFEFGEVFAGVGRIWKECVVGTLVLGLVAIALSFVGFLACFVGVYVTMMIQTAAFAIFRADLARLDVDRGGPVLELPLAQQTADVFR